MAEQDPSELPERLDPRAPEAWNATDQTLALREEIRRAGRGTSRLKMWLASGCVSSLAGGLIFSSIFGGFGLSLGGGPLAFAGAIAIALGALITYERFALPLLTAAYRERRRLWIRDQLRTLPPPQRAAVLLPLMEDPCAETQQIVHALRLDPSLLERELASSPAPEGRGDEVSGS